MEDIIKEFLRRNRNKPLNIHCVGDAMVDEYYSVKVNRISPEFPMPIMHSSNQKPISRPGGVANVAYQFKHFNVTPTLICFPDSKADNVFNNHGVFRWGHFCDIWSKLPVKKRYLDGHVQVKRWDVEAPLCKLKMGSINHWTKCLIEAVAKHGMRPDVVIMSDYDKGFFASDEYNVLDAYRNFKTIVDPKNGPLSKWKGCSIFKPNAREAESLTGRRQWREQAKHIQNELECEAVVITASGDRVAGVWNKEFFCYTSDKKVEVDSTVGAGDCFCAFFAMAIGHGFSVPEAAEIAYNAGAIYVQHNMNKPVNPSDLIVDKFVEPDDLAKKDFKLVFTNGCFDVLHKGHMETLKFAKSKGNKLVVALNSDDSVRRLKGEGRPVVPLEHRMAVMAAIQYVDFVVSFDEDTPFNLIRRIKPDALVKGSEYDESKIIGADIVPEVYTAPMIEGVSTSKLLAG
jgi:D-beta-D-heptose 7-phosphate kinase/D-beta-D-heptose 1-phosphate adenosyltransferase